MKAVAATMRNTTLCYFLRERDTQVLLAMKKRGFGQGKWNGPGGKVEAGETIEDAAIRECTEECGLTPKKDALHQRGIIEFVFEGNPEWNNRCHIFITRDWAGELTETEEMLPRWWSIEDIPYDEMWSDDRLWMPELFAGKEVNYRFFFNKDVLLGQEKL